MTGQYKGDIEVILASVDYPITKDALIDAATEADVEETAIVILQDLPDREYESPEEVSRVIDETQDKEGSGEQKMPEGEENRQEAAAR